MSPDRDIAVAVSEGLNCLAALASAAGSASEAPAAAGEWLTLLEAMERGLEAIKAKAVATSLVIGEEDVERVRRVRVLIADWMREGQPPAGLGGVIDSVLDPFGLAGRRA